MIIKKYFIIVFFIVSTCNSCILMSDKYYETKSIEWQAKSDAAKAYNESIDNRLAEIDPRTGVITLYKQVDQKPMAVYADSNPFIDGLKTTLNSSALKFLTGGLAFKLATDNMQGNTSMYQAGGDMSVTRDSGNSIDYTSTSSEVYGDQSKTNIQDSYNSKTLDKSTMTDDHSVMESDNRSYQNSYNNVTNEYESKEGNTGVNYED